MERHKTQDEKYEEEAKKKSRTSKGIVSNFHDITRSNIENAKLEGTFVAGKFQTVVELVFIDNVGKYMAKSGIKDLVTETSVVWHKVDAKVDDRNTMSVEAYKSSIFADELILILSEQFKTAFGYTGAKETSRRETDGEKLNMTTYYTLYIGPIVSTSITTEEFTDVIKNNIEKSKFVNGTPIVAVSIASVMKEESEFAIIPTASETDETVSKMHAKVEDGKLIESNKEIKDTAIDRSKMMEDAIKNDKVAAHKGEFKFVRDKENDSILTVIRVKDSRKMFDVDMNKYAQKLPSDLKVLMKQNANIDTTPKYEASNMKNTRELEKDVEKEKEKTNDQIEEDKKMFERDAKIKHKSDMAEGMKKLKNEQSKIDKIKKLKPKNSDKSTDQESNSSMKATKNVDSAKNSSNTGKQKTTQKSKEGEVNSESESAAENASDESEEEEKPVMKEKKTKDSKQSRNKKRK